MVIATNNLAPLRPVIEIICDANNQKAQNPRIIDMTKHHLLQIVSASYEEADSCQYINKKG